MGRSGGRLAVLAVLLASMITVLLGRTVQLQAGDAVAAARAEQGSRVRTLTDPAVRGVILDQAGRPLAAHRSVLELTADRDVLFGLPADGADVVRRAAAVLQTTFDELDARLTGCQSPSAVAGLCWDGAAWDPVPLARDLTMERALPFLEQPGQYPGLTVRTVSVREYPGNAGERAGHLLGVLGAATQDEVSAGAAATDVFGRGGLEQQYDDVLRGTTGSQTVLLDTAGRVAQTLQRVAPVHGSAVITSIDAQLQALVEQQLAAAVQRARSAGLAGDTGSAVVVDVTDGRILAMASYPDYAPTIFDGGISAADYQSLSDSGALPFNPVQGLYAPGSTFKPFTVAGMAQAGYRLDGSHPCPADYRAGGRSFTNHESKAYGTLSLARAIEVSCNTVFYRAADDIWAATGGQQAGPQADDPIHDAAAGFGLGKATGIDLPGEATGTLAGRTEKVRQWQQSKASWCSAAASGYPQLRRTDPELADVYTNLDRDNCESGGLWRQGDALNASIGQGLTAVTPLQIAMAYAAIANGGALMRPQVAKAVVLPDGTVQRHDPQVRSRVEVSPDTLRFLTESMVGVTRQGTAAGAFAGFPLDEIPVAGKTGSAQVSGGGSATSWFASFAPANNPRYAVVLMVTQGGTGSATSAPSVRAIYEGLFGIADGAVNPEAGVLRGGQPLPGLPPLPGTADAGTAEEDR